MKIEFQKGALNDFKDRYSFYSEISAELAQRFENDFWDRIHLLKNNPLHFQKRYKDMRVAFFKNFPFGIHFVVEDFKIIALKTLHTSRFVK
jgi:hypothetical protein